uniref:Uncharacterized protein n=1 Tax=Fagus sylvatica TaxID=28930 RepID=A0A2N9EK67_FAGSY
MRKTTMKSSSGAGLRQRRSKTQPIGAFSLRRIQPCLSFYARDSCSKKSDRSKPQQKIRFSSTKKIGFPAKPGAFRATRKAFSGSEGLGPQDLDQSVLRAIWNEIATIGKSREALTLTRSLSFFLTRSLSLFPFEPPLPTTYTRPLQPQPQDHHSLPYRLPPRLRRLALPLLLSLRTPSPLWLHHRRDNKSSYGSSGF